MKTILENTKTHEIDYVDSQVVVGMITGLGILDQVPGAEGNGYKIVNMYYPMNPSYTNALTHAYN